MSDQTHGMPAPIVSVILPTVRPHAIVRVLENLALEAQDLPIEVIVIADFNPPIAHQPWIYRERHGVIDAVHVGYQVARGEYLFVTNDEALCGRHTIRTLYIEALTNPHRLLTPRHEPPFPFSYYGKLFAPFPFAHRTLLDRLGGLLDPAFKAFYADPDLSMRAHAAGVPVEVVENAPIYHNNGTDGPKQENWAAYFEADRATFRARWDHLGAFSDPC